MFSIGGGDKMNADDEKMAAKIINLIVEVNPESAAWLTTRLARLSAAEDLCEYLMKETGRQAGSGVLRDGVRRDNRMLSLLRAWEHVKMLEIFVEKVVTGIVAGTGDKK
jgi:hypothetical protein